jgi:hypothetical protein
MTTHRSDAHSSYSYADTVLATFTQVKEEWTLGGNLSQVVGSIAS